MDSTVYKANCPVSDDDDWADESVFEVDVSDTGLVTFAIADEYPATVAVHTLTLGEFKDMVRAVLAHLTQERKCDG
jgi:hypothetical protein